MRQKIFGSIILFVLFSFLVMLLAQETFRDVLEPLGLYHKEGGIYTDCSLPENRNIKFCESGQHPADKEWRSVKEKPGFSLSGDR